MASLVAVVLLSFALHGYCFTPKLLNLSLDFVQYLGEQDSTLNSSTFKRPDRICLKQLTKFAESLDHDELWAINFYDSWGKIAAGVLFGNTHEVGNYDQCRRARYHAIAGQHCTLEVDVSVLKLKVDPIWYGVCVPAACRPLLIKQMVNSFLQTRGMRVMNDLDLYCFKEENKQFSTLTIVAIVLFSCYGFILLSATVADLVFNGYQEDVPPCIKRFSVYTNLNKIFVMTPKNTTKSGTMDCVNGVRALSMLSIIVYHVHDVAQVMPTVNKTMQVEYRNSVFGVLLYKLSENAVDTFLLLSGMLVAMKVLRELDQDKKLNIVRFYLQRIIRIVPAYAAMLLFTIAFTSHFGDRYLNKAISESINPCFKNWWKLLLFFHNYIDPSEMCYAHTWFISMDMQLYVLSPLILIPLWKIGRRFAGVIVLLALISISWVFGAFMDNHYRLNESVGSAEMRAKTYFPTHARMSVWLFGILFGHYLHQTRFTIIRMTKVFQTVGWIVAATSLTIISYASKKVYTSDYKTIPAIVDAFYESLHRSFWVASLMWIIFACINGYGGLVNQFLSWTCWQPWAKLSYTMYLVHIWVQMVTVTMPVTVPVYFTVTGLFRHIFGLVGFSAAAGIIWSVSFEYPFFGVEKILVKRWK